MPLTLRLDLTDEETLVVWTLGAVGRPMWQADLAQRLPRDLELDRILLILRRFELVRGRAPIDLTSAGMRHAASIARAMDAQHRRELRQLDRLEAAAETAPA